MEELQRVTSPVQLKISPVEYDRVQHELVDTRQRLDLLSTEVREIFFFSLPGQRSLF